MESRYGDNMTKRKPKLTAAQKQCDILDPRVPFSLCCINCDAGMSVVTPEQAILEGWVEIKYNPTMCYNYVGGCPDCLKEGEIYIDKKYGLVPYRREVGGPG